MRAGIAVIARHRRNRKTKSSPRRRGDAEKTEKLNDPERNKTAGCSPCLRVSVVKIGCHRSSSLHRNKEEAGMRETDGGPKSRNMSRYPMVLKDYGIVAYFARGFRYNEQALVYSGLLACNAGLASENAAFTAAYGLKDRPQ